MTHEEITRISAECDIALREERRRYNTLVENAELKHRENVNNESDRYRIEMRRLKIEHDARRDEIIARKEEARMAYARELDRKEALDTAPKQEATD